MIGRHKGRIGSAMVVFAAVGLVVGCSGSGDELPREAVSGTVTFDGQLLDNGSISFTPAGGSTGTPGGDQVKGGKFSIARESGLVPGNYNVAIYSPERLTERTKPKQAGGGKPSELPKQLIPAKYNSKSELTAEIKKGGGNDLTFTLQSK
jgi:hypothetical protein